MGGPRFGKYRLIERIAVGGMAEVFRAEIVGPEGFAREVVLKRVLPELGENPGFVAMFSDEARLAAKLQHPNIVQIFDYDRHEGEPYIAMEYVRGPDLAKLLRRCRDAGRLLPDVVALYILIELAEGLRYAHGKKDGGAALHLVHRDVTPHNVLLSFEGEVKLADFGIAKAATVDARTRTGALKGKYPYMSPEQVEGKTVDHQSDLYAAGVVFYEMLTGARPYALGSDLKLLNEIVQGSFPPPEEARPDLPRPLGALVRHAMATRPEQRVPSAEALLTEARAAAEALGLRPEREALRTFLAEVMPAELASVGVDDITTVAEGEEFRTGEAPGSDAWSGASLPGAFEVSASEAPPTATDRGERPSAAPPSRGGRPSATPPAPAPAGRSSRRRLLLGLGVLWALAVAGLSAVLLSTPAGPEKLTVLLRMMDLQEAWFRQHALAPYGEARDLQLPVTRYRTLRDVETELRAQAGQVDLVKVHLAMLRPLAEAGLIQPVDRLLVDAGRGQELEALLAGFDPHALELARVPDLVSRPLMALPRKLETQLLAFRRSRVEAARAAWPEHADDLELELQRLTGHGLPSDFEIEPDPEAWDSYDLLALGWVWSRTRDGGRTAPRIMFRSYRYFGTLLHLLDALAAAGPHPELELEASVAMLDLFEWEALFFELGLYHPKMTSPDEIVTGRALFEGMRSGEVYLTHTHGLGLALLRGGGERGDGHLDEPEDLGFSMLPRRVSLDLDKSGVPLRAGTRRALGYAWFWAIPKAAPHPLASLELAIELTSKAQQEAEHQVFLIQPVRPDLAPPPDPFGRAVRATYEAQMEANGGLPLPSFATAERYTDFRDALVGAWWDIVVGRAYLDQGKISRARLKAALEARFAR